MPVALDVLMAQRATDVPFAYSERFSMLYAMAVGMGRDPFDEVELDFVYERRGRLRCVPSQGVTIARHDLIYHIGLDVERLLHGEQWIMLHQPIPPAAEVLADHRVVRAIDRGPGKGLWIETASKVRLADGAPLFDLRDLYLARGDGGIGSAGDVTSPSASDHALPQRPPDLVRTTTTLPWQALLYRQSGDRGAIHSEPQVARAAGFAGPILHGSCVLGLACREVLAGVCAYDTARIASLGARFTAVFYPGERLETDIWCDGETAWFRCRAPDRGATVLDRGRCRVVATIPPQAPADVLEGHP